MYVNILHENPLFPADHYNIEDSFITCIRFSFEIRYAQSRKYDFLLSDLFLIQF